MFQQFFVISNSILEEPLRPRSDCLFQSRNSCPLAEEAPFVLADHYPKELMRLLLAEPSMTSAFRTPNAITNAGSLTPAFTLQAQRLHSNVWPFRSSTLRRELPSPPTGLLSLDFICRSVSATDSHELDHNLPKISHRTPYWNLEVT